MSAQPSPDGSPAGASMEGQQANAGEVLAMRMMQAAESAAAAAQAATQAVAALSTGSTGGHSSGSVQPEWYKVLPKPSTFEPKDREAELSGFRDWWWQVEQYIVAVDSNYGQDLLYIRGHLDEEMPLVEQDPEKTRRSGFLYGLLASLLRQRPLMLLKGIEQGNGMEAVRQLFRTCQPSSRNRSLGLLHVIMQWPSFDMKSALLPQVLKLEDSFKEYEKIAAPLPEEIRFAVLMKVLGGQLKTYLQVTLKDGTSYEDLRESALRYDQSTIRWTQSMALGSTMGISGDTAVPMEVDRVEKGKGKKGKSKGNFKGKDKGKGDQKGKASGKKGSDNGKGYNNQQSWGSKQGSWQSSWNAASDNSGKGGKSGKSGKGKDGNKGKDFSCHKCGKPGHYARDCRVRVVGSDGSATAHSGEKSNTVTSATSGSVNRVSFATSMPSSSNFRQLDFDLSTMDGLNSFSTSHVNMVSKQHTNPNPVFNSVNHFSTTFSGETVFGEDLNAFSDDGVGTALERCADEFTKGSTEMQGCADVFTLQPLFQLDDFEHFQQRVFSDYSLHLYDVVSDSGGRALKRFGDEVHLKPCGKRQKQDPSLVCNLMVRAISTCRSMDIILDSGSDVTLIPSHMASLGTQVKPQSETYLRDAQGQRISTHDVRDVNFVFHATDGSVVNVKERAFFSETIDTPLISLGKLVKAGWGIEVSSNGSPMLAHPSGAQVELAFRNNSLTISGTVRVVQHVRKISVDIPRNWQNLSKGWYETERFQICSSGGARFVDPTSDYLVTEWPYRTTVGFHDIHGWEVIELCECLFPMEDRAAAVQGNYQKLLTILSKDVMNVADLGMVITEETGISSGASGSGGSQTVDASTTASVEPMEVVEVPVQMDAQQGSSQLDIPQTMAIQPNMSSVKIAGVTVERDSAISVLKAACGYLQVSQSGSKQKLWNRILATLDKQAINAERELASVALDETKRKAESVQVAVPPTEQSEIDAHMLTHLPYAAWCPACVMAKGRADVHQADPSRVQRRELPIISWDFCFTGKTCEQVDEDSQQSKLTCLILHDSQSGAVHCVPVHHKGQTKYMCQEILRFIAFLGYGDVTIRCDQEHSTLAIQRLVQRARQRLNLKTVIEDAKVGDHGGNAAVEKAIDRIRRQASVYLHALTSKIGFDVKPQHPLFAWAFVHASWTLTRFSVRAGTTPFEVVSGHAYQSKVCPYGCPVMVFVGDTVKQKGDARWQRGIFLTKTWSNDMYLVAVGGSLRVSKCFFLNGVNIWMSFDRF